MNTSILREAEADLVGLPGAIRDEVKAGIAELRRLRDAIDAEIARLTGGAKVTLESLQALGPAGSGAGPEAQGNAPPVPSEDAKPPLTV